LKRFGGGLVSKASYFLVFESHGDRHVGRLQPLDLIEQVAGLGNQVEQVVGLAGQPVGSSARPDHRDPYMKGASN